MLYEVITDDLEIVLHPVVNLAQEDLLLPQSSGELALGPLALGDVAADTEDAVPVVPTAAGDPRLHRRRQLRDLLGQQLHAAPPGRP